MTDAEGYNRNRSKSRKRKDKEKKECREESQANIFAREEPEEVQRLPVQPREDQDDILSKWSCRKCTLENPLQEAVCLACGGSRLSSIGDIEVPRIVEPKNLVNLIRDDADEEILDINNTVREDDNNNKNLKWKCKICTLENEQFNYYCDACNSPSPRKDELQNPGHPVNKVANVLKLEHTDYWVLVNRVVR